MGPWVRILPLPKQQSLGVSRGFVVSEESNAPKYTFIKNYLSIGFKNLLAISLNCGSIP